MRSLSIFFFHDDVGFLKGRDGGEKLSFKLDVCYESGGPK